MDLIDTNSENLYSIDTVITKMHEFAKIFEQCSDGKQIAKVINLFASCVKIANELAVEQAKKDAIDDFATKLIDKLVVGNEKQK